MIQNNISISVKDKIEFNSNELDLLKNECKNIGNVYDLRTTIKNIRTKLNSVSEDLNKYIVTEGVKLNGATLNGALQASNLFIDMMTKNTIIPLTSAHTLNDFFNAYRSHFIIFFVALIEVLYALNQCSLSQLIDAKIGAWKDIPIGVLGNYLTSFFNDYDLICEAIRIYDYNLATTRLNKLFAGTNDRFAALSADLTKIGVSKEAQNFIINLVVLTRPVAVYDLTEVTALANQPKGF